MTIALLLGLVLVAVVAGASWRRRHGPHRRHHLTIVVLAVLILLAGLGVIFTSRGW